MLVSPVRGPVWSPDAWFAAKRGKFPLPRDRAAWPQPSHSGPQTSTGRSARFGEGEWRRGLRRLGGALFFVLELGSGARHERRLEALLDRLLRDHALGDVLARGELEHHVEQRVLDDRAQAAGARLALEGAISDRPQRVVRENELDRVAAEDTLVLLDE